MSDETSTPHHFHLDGLPELRVIDPQGACMLAISFDDGAVTLSQEEAASIIDQLQSFADIGQLNDGAGPNA